MNNIFTLHQRSRRPIALPQTPPTQYGTVENRPERMRDYEMRIIAQWRIWFLASTESFESKEAVDRQIQKFVEQRR